jgi:hypothetical protein
MIGESQNLKENDAITVKIKREMEWTDTRKVKLPYEEKKALKQTDANKRL